MKKGRIALLAVLIATSFLVAITVVLQVLGICPFTNWKNRIMIDYNTHSSEFEGVVSSTRSEHVYIKNENYDEFDHKNSDYDAVFKTMDYFFISGNEEKLFFCKTMDGMNAIGLLYLKNTDWTPPQTGKIIEILDDDGHWYLYSENYL